MLKDKKLWIGVAAAAALGAFVLIRRGGDGGPTGSDEDGAGGGIGMPGMINTSGSDIAAALGNFSQDLQGQLNEFGGRIEDALGQIPSDTPTPSPVVPSPTRPPSQTRPPVKSTPRPPGITRPSPGPRPKTAAQYVTVTKFTSRNPAWNSTLSGIAKKSKTSVANLLKLNPSIRNPNLVHPGQRIRVK